MPSEDASPERFIARDAMLTWVQAIAPYGIFTTDTELRIQTWNQWLVANSGLAAEKVVGRSLFEVFPDAHTRRFEEQFRRALGGEISMLSTALHRYLLPLPPASDEYDTANMLQTARIAPLPSGNLVIGTITIIEDVTQRESQALILQRQQERDRLLSEALGVLLQSSNPLMDVSALFPKIAPPLGLEAYSNYLFEPENQVLRLNASGGISPKRKEALSVLLLGESLPGLCAQRRESLEITALQASIDPHANEAKAAGMRSYYCFPLLIGDRLVGTLSFASYTRDAIAPDEVKFLSKVAQYVAIAMDRALRENALRLAQRSLSEHADNLEVKVAERTARLHETIAQLESFSYTVAHDLRAPIRSLTGYCDILLNDFTLPEGGAAILERLQRASYRLDALTRDLLKFSKISRQDVELEQVDIAELIQDIMVLSPELRKSITVRSPIEKVWAQRTLLQQCFSNLFDNAVKFTVPGTPPAIVVRSERRRSSPATNPSPGGTAFNPATHRPGSVSPFPRAESGAGSEPPAGARIRVWIEDNGIGIAPESHEKIFGIFERVGGNDHIEGTGIGLAIVARAMQQMSGSCGVDSAVGQGSRFWLELAAASGPVPVPRPAG